MSKQGVSEINSAKRRVPKDEKKMNILINHISLFPHKTSLVQFGASYRTLRIEVPPPPTRNIYDGV